MRFSASAILAVAAIGAHALPQDVQPITQISDGQIQAPPATAPAVPAPSSYEVPSVPAATEVLPSVTPVPLPSPIPSSAPAPVVPSSGYSVPAVVPVPSGSAPPYPISSGAIYTNGTVAPTGGVSTSAPAGETSGSPQPSAPANSGAAANMVSFAALFAGVVAYLA